MLAAGVSVIKALYDTTLNTKVIVTLNVTATLRKLNAAPCANFALALEDLGSTPCRLLLAASYVTSQAHTHLSASLQGPSSVHPLCATGCLQQVGFGVPPEHHLSLHLPTTFCLLHSGGWEEGCVITPSRYLQPPAMWGPTVQSRAVALTTCTELCNAKN